MRILAEFDGLTLRVTDTLGDLEKLSDWIQADDAHRDIYSPHFFMGGKFSLDDRPSYYALEDDQGVIFYIRLSRASRVRIQFAPDSSEQRSRNMRGLLHGMAFLENVLAQAGCEEWIFDTDNPELKKTAERILGFTESTHELVRAIAEPEKKKEVA
jgi:hypothetical protein